MGEGEVGKREGREEEKRNGIRMGRGDMNEVDSEGSIVGGEGDGGAVLGEGGIEDAFLIAPRVFLYPEWKASQSGVLWVRREENHKYQKSMSSSTSALGAHNSSDSGPSCGRRVSSSFRLVRLRCRVGI